MIPKVKVALAVVLTLGVCLIFAHEAYRSTLRYGYLGTAGARPIIGTCIGLILLLAAVSFIRGAAFRRFAAIGSVAAALLFFGVMAAASGMAVQIFATLLVLLTAFGIGSAALGLLRVEAEFSALERIALAAGLGLGLLSDITVLLGLSEALYPLAACGVLVALLALSYRSILRWAVWLRKEGPSIVFEHATAQPLFFGVLLLFFSVALVQALAPPIQYDDLHYHLFDAQQHVAAHRLVLLPDVIQSYFYQGVEMLYTIAFLIGGEATAITVNASFGILTALALAGFASRMFSREAGWLSSILWTTTPMVAWLMTTGYADLGAALFSFLSTVAAYASVRRMRWQTAFLGGVFGAFAVSAKLNATLFVFALMSVLLLVLLVSRRFGDSVRLAGSYATGFVPFVCVWPVLRLLQTGNPVYPFLNGVFRAPGYPPVNGWFNFGDFGLGTSLISLLALPWNITFHGDRFIEALHPYVLGPCLLFAVVACFFTLSRIRGELRWSILIALLYVGAWFLRAQFLRYLLPALPLISLIAAVTLLRVLEPLGPPPRRFVLTILCASGASALLVIWLASYYNIPERVPFRVIVGAESRPAYLARTVAVYPAFQAVGKACESSVSSVLSIGNELGYLCPKMIPWTARRASFVLAAASDGEYRAALRELGVSYLVVDETRGDTSSLPFVSSGFPDRAGELIYSGRGVTVFRMPGPGEQPKRQVVRAEPQVDAAPYHPGLLEPLDPTFEHTIDADSRWKPGLTSHPGLVVGSDTAGYPPASEGRGALHINLPGPSDERMGNIAVASFPKATVQVSPGSKYIFSYDLLCAGLIDSPLVNLHFTGPGETELSETRVLSGTVCDTKWRRLRARVTVPEGATGLYPEFGLSFSGDFSYARYVELDRLGLELVKP